MIKVASSNFLLKFLAQPLCQAQAPNSVLRFIPGFAFIHTNSNKIL